MKTSLMLLLCAFASLLISSNALCQANQKAFDSLLTAQFAKDGPGGVALVAKDGKVIYKKAFGMANLELDVPMHTNNVFRIGSNTKQFTAAAILKLAQEGRLSLNDDITKFINDYPTHGKIITIQNLLTHTSGVKNYTGISKWNQDIKRKDIAPKQLVDFFKDEPMDFDPGTDYRYSNSGYVLLGYIIELITGKPYAQYIAENFFGPLGMKNSYYDTASMLISNRTSGYQQKNGHYENVDFVSMTLPYAAGGLLSTVDDMFTWYQAVMAYKVINKENLEKAQTSYLLPNGRPTGYGYGWATGNVQGSPSIKHAGIVNGFVTYAVYLPREKVFVAIFSNCECTGDLDIPASKMAAMLLNKPYLYSSIKLPESILEAYQGIYNTPYDGNKIIAVQDDRLVYYSKGGSKSTLIPYKKDHFYIENSLLSLQFERNATGEIAGFDLKSTGLPLKGTRSPEKIKTLKRVNIDTKTLEKYAGHYQFNPTFDFYIVKEGDKLYGRVGSDKKELVPYGSDRFFAKDLDAAIIFTMDANGKVAGLTKIQNNEMSAKRVD